MTKHFIKQMSVDIDKFCECFDINPNQLHDIHLSDSEIIVYLDSRAGDLPSNCTEPSCLIKHRVQLLKFNGDE